MALRLHGSQNLFAGSILLGVAAVGFFSSRRLAIGSLAHMGPGFLPMAMVAVIGVLGLVLVLTAFRPGTEETPSWPHWRPWLFIGAAPLVFALLIDMAGFVVTVAATALVGRLGVRHPFGWDLIWLPLALSAFCTVLFVVILDQPVQLWPW